MTNLRKKLSGKKGPNFHAFHGWTTENLRYVVEEPYHRGKNGHDYGPVIDEIRDEYQRRLAAKNERETSLIERLQDEQFKTKKDKHFNIRTSQEQNDFCEALGGKSKAFNLMYEFFIANAADADTLRLFGDERQEALETLMGK